MKNLVKYFLILFFVNNIYSQSGRIIYSIQVGVDLTEVPKDKVDFITQMVNNAKNQQFELAFNGSKSSFKIVEKLGNRPEYEVKMENIASAAFTSSKDVYIDYDHKIEIYKTKEGLLVESKYNSGNWEVSTESKKIANYVCYKAIKKIPFIDRKGQSKVKEVFAWFAPSLPYSYGPKNFYGLPGLILELTENRATYLATIIDLESERINIDFPKGKSVTEEVYNKSLKAQMGM